MSHSHPPRPPDPFAEVREILKRLKQHSGPVEVAIQTILIDLRSKQGSPSKRGQPRLQRLAEQADVGRELSISKLAHALALLIEHPEWPDIRIAKAIHVSRSTLYTWWQFRAAKAWLKSGRQELPRGTKAPDGTLEAYLKEDKPDEEE